MFGPRTARWARGGRFVVVASLLAVPGRGGQPPATVHFSVITPANSLLLEREQRPPGPAIITHLRLTLDEPVWTTETPGWPELPFVTRTVAVPPGAQIVGVTSNLGQGIPSQGVGLLYWAQRPRIGAEPQLPVGPDGSLDFVFYPAPDEVPPDPGIAQMQAIPAQLVEQAEERTVAGYRLVTYRVYPVQWYPGGNILLHYPQIDVDVALSGAGTGQAPASYAAALLIDDLKAGVVNPGSLVGADPLSFPPGPDTRYLVITDNYRWSGAMTKGAPVGDMVKEFKRLAAWKTAKGVKGAVVTIADIVRGRWGDFTTGARDLQEVIRNFLKFAHREWSTYWVLLGGNVQVVPPRVVAANVNIKDHYLWGSDDAYPAENQYHYDAASNTVRIHQAGSIGVDTPIVAVNSGKAFKRDIFAPTPSAASPGWLFTDPTYTDVSYHPPGPYVLLRGAPADVDSTDFYAVLYTTSIPTDLYYASLEGDDYDLPGLHDWDKNDNGLYGQYNFGDVGDLDGVSLAATVAVGRATVANAVEAARFVDKVIAYEKYDGVLDDFGRTVMLTADDWYGGPAVKRWGVSPPAVGQYFSALDSTTAILHFDGPPGPKAAFFRLIAWNTSGDWWEVPFDLAASPTSLGYYYCTSDTYATPSLLTFDISSLTYELYTPTSFVRVIGPTDRMRPSYYFFDYTEADPAVTQKEQVRAKLATVAPGVDILQRYYKDLLDTPDYPAPMLSMLSETSVRDALDGGVNLVSLAGHGWWGGCCGVSATWVPGLTNGFAGGVVYADSCLTNELDKPKADDTSPDATGERFLKGAGGGAAAYVGNTRYSLIGVGSVFELLFWNRLATTRHLGLLHMTKELYGAGQGERWVNYSLNLDGDPEMPLWTGRPTVLKVTHPPVLPTQSQALVTVSSQADQAISAAVVCITGPRGFIVVGATDAGGATLLSLAGARSGDELTVTVTGDGLVPHQSTLTVRDPAHPHRRLPAHPGS